MKNSIKTREGKKKEPSGSAKLITQLRSALPDYIVNQSRRNVAKNNGEKKRIPTRGKNNQAAPDYRFPMAADRAKPASGLLG